MSILKALLKLLEIKQLIHKFQFLITNEKKKCIYILSKDFSLIKN